MTPRILGIAGWSGSGKTTLLEYLLPQLAAQGLRVNVIKHSHHDLELEPPHKDSARLRAAGATEVLLSSPYRFALIHELRGAPEPALAEQVARMSAADLTLVEGFKREPIPKLEIHRPALGKPALYPDDMDIVAVASDSAPPLLARRLAWLDLGRRDQILAWVMMYAKNGVSC
ncbi:molybdopterin-guanine dinucleotide biosynthesis protein B [Herminiimonas sp. CN]|uniref:molybdopterin-guanine dinucleotide biosynthesis protein B n=1 Tax=Herminiimonas sp. CN TaxID=1349818 RepID=UPI0005553E29|nr:molybdopterin-guanine dinucleotide biosynthesis protein B [Herminiimonas sp. CN]